MDPIFNDFDSDLKKICDQLDFIDALKKLSGCIHAAPEKTEHPSFINEALTIYETSKQTHTNLPIVSGTLILYTCGRFEAMARTLFEDLCQRLVSRATKFSKLPKKMRENLPIFTAKVIAEPRKYGHAEGGVRSFVTTLASNLEPEAIVTKVNHECLSITESNMRADILSELFSRIGAEKIWARISEQASMKIYFEQSDSSAVESLAKKKLNELMDLRNKIAHPSSELNWPSTGDIRDYVEFLRITAKALADQIGVYEVTLCQNTE